jgi:hypothetical protein
LARELFNGKNYYLSHGTAIEIHGMVTQPQFVIHVATPKKIRSIHIMGTDEHIQEQFDQAFKYAQQASGIRLNISRIDRYPHENSHSFFIGYEGPLPGGTGKEVKVDMKRLLAHNK